MLQATKIQNIPLNWSSLNWAVRLFAKSTTKLPPNSLQTNLRTFRSTTFNLQTSMKNQKTGPKLSFQKSTSTQIPSKLFPYTKVPSTSTITWSPIFFVPLIDQLCIPTWRIFQASFKLPCFLHLRLLSGCVCLFVSTVIDCLCCRIQMNRQLFLPTVLLPIVLCVLPVAWLASFARNFVPFLPDCVLMP